MVNNNLEWRYFLALEKDFIETFDYLEVCTEHHTVYSLKYRAIILQACSEIDKLFKKIIGAKPDKNKNIDDYYKFIEEHHAGFIDISIKIPKLNMSICPWQGWTKGANPAFWKDGYNKIKHQGDITKANQIYTLNALCGLFSLLLATYSKAKGQRFSRDASISLPLLLEYPGLGACSFVTEGSYYVTVPGFS